MYTKTRKTLTDCKKLRPKCTQKNLLGSQYSIARSIYTWILGKPKILGKLSRYSPYDNNGGNHR